MALCKGIEGDIYYSAVGQGEPLVLLRGLGRSSRYWLGFDEHLTSSFRVITIDLRGIGRSTKPLLIGDSMDAIARDVIDVLDELRIPVAHIFGLSLGGMVAMELVARFSSRFRCVVIGASSSRDSSRMRIKPSALFRLILALPLRQFHETLFQIVAPTQLSSEQRLASILTWRTIRTQEGFPWKTIFAQVLAARKFEVSKRIQNQMNPTLILCGTEDAFIPVANSIGLHSLITGAQFQWIQGAGHELTLGFEETVAGLLKSFTTQHPIREE